MKPYQNRFAIFIILFGSLIFHSFYQFSDQEIKEQQLLSKLEITDLAGHETGTRVEIFIPEEN